MWGGSGQFASQARAACWFSPRPQRSTFMNSAMLICRCDARIAKVSLLRSIGANMCMAKSGRRSVVAEKEIGEKQML
jgi:hypothetical protein